ncbi:Ge1-WD40 domain-containing protein [Aphelenchoides bicaudatus]|nr:Ge1-WD40 domain-containing protein [Aphelenchoides bicaudatus]
MMNLLTPETLAEKYSLNSEGSVVGFAAGRNVVLQVSEDLEERRERDSAHANSQMLAEYKWEQKTAYKGRILSTGSKFLAYRLFNDTTGQAIRVMNRESRTRTLIKDFRADPVDLLWASHAPLLAVLDQKNNVYVYHMGGPNCNLTKYLNIIRNADETETAPRLVWCPYVEEEDKDNDTPLHLLAVMAGKHVDLYFLNTIKEASGQSEVEASSLDGIEGGVISIDTDSEITSVRISPDATAFAITCTDGNLIFYIIENGVARKTHKMMLLPNTYVEDMLFLDNCVQQPRNTAKDLFWKHVILVSDSGRRLAIYDCVNWECIAKIRFESNQLTKLDVHMDPTARYIYLTDYENSNLFCLEVTPDFPDTQPYFVACAQICFSTPLICLSVCALQEKAAEQDDFLLDDEAPAEKHVEVEFVAINHRSLTEIRVDLQRILDIDLNVEPEKGTKIMQEKLTQQSHQLKLSNFAASNQRLTSSLGSSSEILETSPRQSAQPKEKEKIVSPEGSIKRRSHQPAEHHHHQKSDNNGSDSAFVMTALLGEIKKLQHSVQELHTMNSHLTDLCHRQEKRTEELNAQLEKMNKDNLAINNANYDFRREQADNLSDVLEKICKFLKLSVISAIHISLANEISARDEHVETVINRMNDKLRSDVKKIVEASLNDNAVSLQATMELTNGRVVETVKSVLTQVLVPSVDQICTQLFHQLNENFRDGLQEFLDQIQSTGERLRPPSPSLQTQLIEGGQLTFYIKPNKQRQSIDSINNKKK